MGNGIHAADWLKQSWIRIQKLLVVHFVTPEVGLHQFTKIQRVNCFTLACQSGVEGYSFVAAAIRAFVQVVRIQSAIPPQHRQDIFFFFACQWQIQRVRVYRFCEHLRNITPHVCDYLAACNRFAAESFLIVKKCSAVVIGEHFQFNAEFFAIIQYGSVMIGNAGRSHIRVHVPLRVKSGELFGIRFFQNDTRTRGEISSASTSGSFKDCAAKTRF